MRTELIIIGDEILQGRTIDTNSAYIGQKLEQIGISVSKKIVVKDEKAEIEKALKSALDETDIIITAGGLGPTKDDITKYTIASSLNKKLVLDPKILEKVKEHFRKRGIKMPPINKNQALIIEGSKPLPNPIGTAPGMFIEYKKKLIFSLPGVPSELKAIFEDSIIPILKQRDLGTPIYQKILRTTGIAESEIAEKLESIENLAFLPSYKGVDIVIKTQNSKLKTQKEKKVKEVLGDIIYGEGDEKLEEVVGNLLKERNLTISVAESCTGGLIMNRIVNVPGSSDYFKGGIVAYSNYIKQKILLVNTVTLQKFGAVSKETAIEMANNVREILGTDIGISATGIAGPGGATKDKPVGLVYIALATKKKAPVKRHLFTGTREIIRERTAQASLDMIRQAVLNYEF